MPAAGTFENRACATPSVALPTLIQAVLPVFNSWFGFQPSGAPRLTHSFVWTLAANAVYAFCQWALLIALARMGNPILVGVFALSVAVVSPVFMLTNLQLRAIQATDSLREYAFADYFGLRLMANCAALPALLTTALVLRYPGRTVLTIILFGAAKTVEAVSDVLYGLMQQHEELVFIAKSMMAKGLLSVVAFAVALSVWHALPLACAALVLAWSVVLCVYDLPCAIHLLASHGDHVWPLPWSFSKIWSLARAALPMGVVLMIASVTLNLPRYFIARYSGEEDVGFFSALSYFIQVGAIVVAALGNSVCTRLSIYHASRRHAAFWRLLRNIILLSALTGVSAILVALIGGRIILVSVYGPAYAKYAPQLVGLMIAGSLYYVGSCFGTGVTAARRFSLQLGIQVVILAIALPMCYLWISKLGLQGAVAATIGVAAVFTVVHAAALLWTERGSLKALGL